MYSDEILSYYAPGYGTTFTYGETGVPYIVATTATFESVDSSLLARIEFAFYNESNEEVPVQYETFELMGGSYVSNGDGTYIVYGLSRMFEYQVINLIVSSIETSSVSDGWYFDEVSEGLVYFAGGTQLTRTLKSILIFDDETIKLTFQDERYHLYYVYISSAEYADNHVNGQIEDTETEVHIYIDPNSVNVDNYDENTVECTIYFNPGDGDGSMENVIVLQGSTYEISDCDFTFKNHSFLYWMTEDRIEYYPGDPIVISSDITLIAQWDEQEQFNNYIVSFDANGGTGTMEEIETDNGAFNVPECEFTYENHSFLYWMTSDGTIFTAGDPAEISSDITLIAQWEASSETKTFTISFNPNGGIGYMESLTVEAGRNQVPECGFTRPGYIFDCWAVDSAESDSTASPGTYVSVDSNYVLFAIWAPAVQPEVKIEQDTIKAINDQMGDEGLGLSSAQQSQINQVISDNKDYISDDAGQIVAEALYNTDISTDPVIAEAQKELVVTVVETGLTVDATKASSISGAQQIDKALPDNVHFSVEGEIDEFYQRQMYELFGGEAPSRIKTRAYANNYEINTDTKGKSGTEAVQYLGGEAEAYQKMVGFVDNSVGHMGKAALKLRKCSGESVVVQVKSYVSVVKVSSFREFDKAAADKKFVEEVYKAIMLSMQNEVIAILEKEHEPSKNAEKEAQYQQELDAVKDFETFEIMVTEVLRQKYNTLIDEPIEDVDEFRPIYWEIFTAWALDQPSPYKITLEELTQATIEESTSRARAFTVHSDLSTREWVFIGSIVGGAALVISAAAIIPRIVYKKKEKEGIR